ncbi:MAG TPA: hypothetical protein VGG19_18870 [Tepidisphaeraceae bacterium]
MGDMIIGMVLAAGADAQITKMATFENYTEGQNFKPSFTDPLSGITFFNSTGGTQNFVIEYSSMEFGGGNYLTSALYSPGSGGSWAASFGFTADLPTPANSLSISVTHSIGNTSTIQLEAFNSNNVLVAQKSAISNAPDPFTLEVISTEYDIASFKMIVSSQIGTGYDNISYTYLPEPASLAPFALLLFVPRKHHSSFKRPS